MRYPRRRLRANRGRTGHRSPRAGMSLEDPTVFLLREVRTEPGDAGSPRLQATRLSYTKRSGDLGRRRSYPRQQLRCMRRRVCTEGGWGFGGLRLRDAGRRKASAPRRAGGALRGTRIPASEMKPLRRWGRRIPVGPRSHERGYEEGGRGFRLRRLGRDLSTGTARGRSRLRKRSRSEGGRGQSPAPDSSQRCNALLRSTLSARATALRSVRRRRSSMTLRRRSSEIRRCGYRRRIWGIRGGTS